MGNWEFEIVAMQKTNPPLPGHKGSWYRYTIANRITEITGTRRGTRAEVFAFLNSSLQRLNARHRTVSFGNT
jgi:hypothetical protein